MLELRPNCECCAKDLPPASDEAMICTYECTFCRDCVERILHGRCPNCGGNFTPRPIRPPWRLALDPASDVRFVQSHPGCAASAVTVSQLAKSNVA